MVQNTLVIDNQAANPARLDIEQAIQAVATNSSDATASPTASSPPSTTYPNMWWYDTYTNTLNIRNAANTAWINVADINQSSSRYEPYNAVPIGAVNTFAMNTAPTGWLSCDGALISRTTYSNLFSVVGTIYGAGDGSTTFKMPDLRGEFVRGWDASRGVDTGRVFGSAQSDAIRNITGTLTASKPQSATGVFTVLGGQGGGADGGQSTAGLYTFDASTQVPTASENRPRSIAMLYCIKY